MNVNSWGPPGRNPDQQGCQSEDSQPRNTVGDSRLVIAKKNVVTAEKYGKHHGQEPVSVSTYHGKSEAHCIMHCICWDG